MEALEAVREQLWNAGGRAIAVACDCTDPDALADLVKDVEAELGPPAVLAAFAGGAGAPKPTLQLSLDDWNRTIASDLTSVFATIQAFVPGMIERGRGSIVTMSSAAGRQPSRASIAYAAAKAGVGMLTRHLAAELAPNGIRVNCIAPSAVHNERMDLHMTEEQRLALGSTFPLGRIGEPEDVAAVAFLASDASGWITGTTLDIAGGKVIL